MHLEVIHEKPQGIARPTPLLFVHGKWHAAWCWQEHFLPYFAEHGYDCHALSLRGHGASEGSGKIRWHSIADYVSDVAQVAGSLETPPVLIGHSMGGFIVQKYLESHPSPAAVLLSAIPPFGLWQPTWLVFSRHPLLFLKCIVTMRLYPIVSTPALAGEWLFSADMPEDQVATYQKRLQNESFRAYLDELGLNLVQTRRIKTPLLIIGAERDAVIPSPLVRATAKRYGTQAEVFPGMAHDVMLEAGWEGVAGRILAWLQGQGV